VWGNDLGDGDYDGMYQADKTNQLDTPVIATDWYTGVFLAYYRWLNVEDGLYDHATVIADGNPVWINWDSAGGVEHTQDRQWAAEAVDLQGAGDDGSVQVSWQIDSDEGLQMGGWTIDDVCLYAPATPDNRLGIGDFAAGDDEDGGITLSWTNPRHAPVERVVVVRKTGAYPAGPTDGTVVYDENAPELEAPISVKDTEVDSDTTYFYAVYASDGTDWLSWTREGFNADQGSATGDTEGDPGHKGGGCGCDASGSLGAGWLVGLAGLLSIRRRR